jgi:hypothetical protein
MAHSKEKLSMKAALKKYEGSKADKAKDMAAAKKMVKKARGRG